MVNWFRDAKEMIFKKSYKFWGNINHTDLKLSPCPGLQTKDFPAIKKMSDHRAMGLI